MTTIGIIGGSGVYALDGLENIQEHTVDTPFGAPSDAVITGELDGTQLVFIPLALARTLNPINEF